MTLPSRSAGPGSGCRRTPRASREASGGLVPASLLHGLEIERGGPLSDLAAQDEPVLTGAPEVDAGIDSGVGALPRRVGEARERSGDSVEWLPARDREAGLVAAEGAGEGHRGGRAEGALGGRIVRDRRRILMAVPGRVADGGVVAVVVALPDGGHWSP